MRNEVIISYNCALLVKAFGCKLEAFLSEDGNQNSKKFFDNENFCFYAVAV